MNIAIAEITNRFSLPSQRQVADRDRETRNQEFRNQGIPEKQNPEIPEIPKAGIPETKSCSECGGTTFWQLAASDPGDPSAWLCRRCRPPRIESLVGREMRCDADPDDQAADVPDDPAGEDQDHLAGVVVRNDVLVAMGAVCAKCGSCRYVERVYGDWSTFRHCWCCRAEVSGETLAMAVRQVHVADPECGCDLDAILVDDRSPVARRPQASSGGRGGMETRRSPVGDIAGISATDGL